MVVHASVPSERLLFPQIWAFTHINSRNRELLQFCVDGAFRTDWTLVFSIAPSHKTNPTAERVSPLEITYRLATPLDDLGLRVDTRIGPTEADPGHCCRSIRVEEMGQAVPGFVRAGRPRSRVVFVPIRVHSCPFVVHLDYRSACQEGAGLA